MQKLILLEENDLSFLYYGVAVLSCLIVFAFLFFNKGKDVLGSKINNKKLIALIYGALFFVRYLGGIPAIQNTIGLNERSPFGPQGATQAFFSIILLWLIYAVQLALVTFPFFEKHVPIVGPIVKYCGTFVYAASLVAIPWLNRALNGNGADGFHYRLLVLALEIGVGLAFSVFQLIDVKDVDFNVKKYLKSAAAFLGMLVMTLPNWGVKALVGLGDSSIVLEDLTLQHRLMLYGLPVFFITVHALFTRCEYEQRRYALIYISMAAMINFSCEFTLKTLITPYQWPLHLCELALYIIPTILIFKLTKLYYFTIFINVLGALFAMLMPNTGGVNWLSLRSFYFWNDHYIAMLLPLLILSLRMFPRPKMKEFTYSLLGFSGYYLVVLVANAVNTGLGHRTDYFFINSDFIADKLGMWAEDLLKFDFTFELGGHIFTLYPLYQLLYFIGYALFSLGMWFVYEQIFEVTDTYEIIMERNRKIKADRLALEAQLAGRSMQEPINPQNEGKLILRNFSKRYSTSDVYAVYKANLEIDGGQIFGFLGPNGAGKSSIIKTIVGIQTITSGEIEVSGFDVDKQSVEAKMQIGYVPDHYALYENLSGREYINYIADLYNVSKEDRDARMAEYIARFRLETAIDNPMKTYSHGMKQKITIMSALVHNPKIWILDEPLTGLDPESIFQVKECMKEHAARGNLVFFSSHIIDVVENICDRIAIIRKGQILCTKTVAEIKQSGVPLETFYMNMIDGNTQAPVSVKEDEAMQSKTVGEKA